MAHTQGHVIRNSLGSESFGSSPSHKWVAYWTQTRHGEKGGISRTLDLQGDKGGSERHLSLGIPKDPRTDRDDIRVWQWVCGYKGTHHLGWV